MFIIRRYISIFSNFLYFLKLILSVTASVMFCHKPPMQLVDNLQHLSSRRLKVL